MVDGEARSNRIDHDLRLALAGVLGGGAGGVIVGPQLGVGEPLHPGPVLPEHDVRRWNIDDPRLCLVVGTVVRMR